jgi:hypothetical protein
MCLVNVELRDVSSAVGTELNKNVGTFKLLAAPDHDFMYAY